MGPFRLGSKDQVDRDAEFSEDLKCLVTYGGSDTAQLWSLTSDKPAEAAYDLATGTKKDIEVARFSPDGKWVFACPCLWRIEGGKPSSQPICLKGAGGHFYSFQLSFTANSKRLLLDHQNAADGVSLWDLNAANPAQATIDIKGRYAISQDKQWVMQYGEPARLWDLAAGPVRQDGGKELHGPAVQTAVFSNGSSMLATLHSDGSILVHAMAGGNVRSVVVHEKGMANRLQFGPQDSWLLATAYSNHPGFTRRDVPHLFRLKKGASPSMVLLDDSNLKFVERNGKKFSDSSVSATEFEFSPNERWLIARQTSSTMAYCWDLAAEKISESLQLMAGHEYGVSYFNFVARGDTVITTESYDPLGDGPHRKRPRIWDLAGAAKDAYPVAVAHPDQRVLWGGLTGRETRWRRSEARERWSCTVWRETPPCGPF